MATARLHRLARELAMLQSDPPPGVAAWPVDEADISRFHASIQGPEGTPYEAGVFRLELELSERYPFEPPMVRFVTPIYHPNIDERGRICLDTLKPQPQGSWTPSLNLPTLLTTIRLLLAHPNAEDGLVPEATEVYRRDPRAFDRLARQHTARHATAAASASAMAAAATEGELHRGKSEEAGEEWEGMQGVTTAAGGAGGDGEGEGEGEGDMKVGAGGTASEPAVGPGAVGGEGGEMEEGDEEDEEDGARRWDSDVSICGEDEGADDSCSTGSGSSLEDGDGDGMGGGGGGGDGVGQGVEERKRGGGGGGGGRKGRARARGGGGSVEAAAAAAAEPELFVVSAEGLPPAKRARRR